jgi:nuclear pore complex protein Nup37
MMRNALLTKNIEFVTLTTNSFPQTILSLDCPSTSGLPDPLACADLCPGNSLLVAGVAALNGQRHVWDVSRSSQPLESTPAHPEGGLLCQFSTAKPHLFASVGQSNGQLRVFNIQTSQNVFSVPCPSTRGLSWHSRLCLLAVGGDKKVIIWKVEN